MSWRAWPRAGHRAAAAAVPGCAGCRHFTDDARALAAALPGLVSLSSAQGSATGDDGLCLLHERFTGARRRCPGFAPR